MSDIENNVSSGSINALSNDGRSYGTLPKVMRSVNSDNEEDPLVPKNVKVYDTPPPNASVVINYLFVSRTST